MSPGPGEAHQSLLVEFTAELRMYFKGKECRVYAAPFDVMLPEDDEPEDEIDTVVQPDIMVVCDKSKIQHNGIKGAPDVVFEIISPSTARRDLDDKFRLYERAGVKEYVIADPRNRVIHAYRRDAGGRFSFRKVYGADDVLEFGLFPELKIPLSPVWEYISELPIEGNQ
jgi:Uma2 family endonuclease